MDILAIAQNGGMKPMFFDGLDKVLRGVTSLEELQRVAVPPDAYVEKK